MSLHSHSLTGMNDILPQESLLWQKLEEAAQQVFSLYGYQEIRTPLIEQTSLFARGIGEQTEVVGKEMYSFEDKGGEHITLRPEGTAGTVRAFIEHNLTRQDPITKLYYKGAMFRYERPQKGRLRQFHQIGAEFFGSTSPHADAEIVILADRLFKRLQIKNYNLEVNSLGTPHERKNYLKILVDYFSPQKEMLCELCQGRLHTNPMRLFDCKNDACKKLYDAAPKILDALGPESKNHFDTFLRALDEASVRYRINPLIVRGLDYYEHVTFEFSSSDLGSQSAFAGGGRYNRLVEELGGPATPAVGFALGCERVILLLQQNTSAHIPQGRNGIYFVSFDAEGLSQCRKLTQKAHDENLKAECAYEVKSLKSQMKRADRLGCKWTAILGEDEIKNNTITVKDLDSGEQQSIKQSDIFSFVKKF